MALKGCARMTDAHRRANARWNKSHADRWYRPTVLIPSGCKHLVEGAAKDAGLSVSRFVQQAILDALDLTEWPTSDPVVGDRGEPERRS